MIRSIPTLLLLSSLGIAGCSHAPPKPPGYDSISEAQADGVPPILSQEQLEGLSLSQLNQRITALDRTRRNTHGNPGVSAVLDSQYQAAVARRTQLQAGP